MFLAILWRVLLSDQATNGGIVYRGISIGGVVVLVWLVVGLVAAAQRGYLDRGDSSCAGIGTIAITMIAGPLNYFGVNPRVTCEVSTSP